MNKIKCRVCGWMFKDNKNRHYKTKAGKKIDCIRCCAANSTSKIRKRSGNSI